MSVFLILGFIQVFMLFQAKVMAQYAVYQAARLGSTQGANCNVITRAAVFSLLPSFHNFLSAGSGEKGSPGQRLREAFHKWRGNDYGGSRTGHYRSWGGDAIVWISRVHPKVPDEVAAGTQDSFDNPMGVFSTDSPIHLELKMLYWAPLQIPFADWVLSRIALAQWGILSFNGDNPLNPVEHVAANGPDSWDGSGDPFGGNTTVTNELLRRVKKHHYVMPIVVNYVTRMMSPVETNDFSNGPGCWQTPSGFE